MNRFGINDVRVHENTGAAAAACAVQVLEWLRAVIGERGRASLAISGGLSARPMFEIFAEARFSWDSVDLFWVDERCVPADDEQSNYKLAHDAWLRPCGFPAANVHRVQGELAAAEGAARYRDEIRRGFTLDTGELPRFDVIHLGIGPDAHTASLFPGEVLLDNDSGIAQAVWSEKFQQWRVTLLPGVLRAARHTALLVTGAEKAGALQAVLQGPHDPSSYPAQIALGERSVWFVDAAAAQETQQN